MLRNAHDPLVVLGLVDVERANSKLLLGLGLIHHHFMHVALGLPFRICWPSLGLRRAVALEVPFTTASVASRCCAAAPR